MKKIVSLALFLMSIFLPLSLKADSTEFKKVDCNTTLRACINLVDEEAESITMLKAQVKAQQDALAKQEEGSYLPWYIYVGVGALAGGFIVHEVSH
jgi:hypothetical protein